MINEINVKDLVLDEYADYTGQCIGVFDRNSVEDEQLKILLDSVRPLHQKLNQLNNKLQTSSHTELIREADIFRDNEFLCMRHIVEGYSYHSDQEKRENALYILSVIRAKGWSMHAQTYSKQSGIMRSLVEEFKNNPKLQAAFESIGQTQRIVGVENAQVAFENKLAQRTDKEAQKSDLNATETAKLLHVEFRKLMQYLEIFMQISPNPAYKNIAASIEEINTTTQAKVKARKTRRENEKTEENEIIPTE